MKRLTEYIFATVFFRSKSIAVQVIAAFFVNMAVWGAILMNLDVVHQAGRDYIILHYQLFYGPDYYSNWYFVFIPSLVGLILLPINLFTARYVYPYNRTIAQLLATAALIAQLLLLIGTVIVIRINIL